MRRTARRQILRVTQSPLNPLIWVIDLSCGHEITVAQKRRPAKMSVFRDKDTGEKLCGNRTMQCYACPSELSL